MKKWTIEDSKELYNINGWGTSYFGINEEGDVYVTFFINTEIGGAPTINVEIGRASCRERV